MICSDSDLLILDVRPSLIPNGGLGVFSKIDIPKETILCEYRGPIFNSKVQSQSNRDMDLNNDLFISGNSIASLINDCVLVKEYSQDEINLMKDTKKIPLHFLRDHNCIPFRTLSKVFIVATRDIKMGEELYFFYGVGYWIGYFQSLIKK